MNSSSNDYGSDLDEALIINLDLEVDPSKDKDSKSKKRFIFKEN